MTDSSALGLMRQRAMRLLARRDYSRHELRARLLRYDSEVDAQSLDALLDDMQQAGWLSDHRRAEGLVRGSVQQHRGPRWIRQKAAHIGFSDEASAQMEAELCEQDWLSLAEQALSRKYSPAALNADRRQQARAYAYLQRRGFSADQVRRAVRRFCDDRQNDFEQD